MANSARMFYFYLISIILLFLIIEAVLEYRHYLLGYKTPIFGTRATNIVNHLGNVKKVSNKTKSSENSDTSITSIYGPTPNFPFKSKIIGLKRSGTSRVWIASASHGEGGMLDANEIFPNLIYQSIHLDNSCEIINASKAGFVIEDNIDQLNKYAPYLQPDYAILYQMSMDIIRQQGRLKKNSPHKAEINNSIFNVSKYIKNLQSLSLYVHVSVYIGGAIKLFGPTRASLPSVMDNDFTNQVNLFIDACKKNNITPVIATFAASHNKSNMDRMTFRQRINLLRYGAYLSPEGWINTISRYNEILRDIAIKEGIPLIDLGQGMNGSTQYFTDFVHFNREGHNKIAEIIGGNLEKIISNKDER